MTFYNVALAKKLESEFTRQLILEDKYLGISIPDMITK